MATPIIPYRTSTFLFSYALIAAADSIDSTLYTDLGLKLAAEVLLLGAAARREKDQARRDVLLARARMIQGCVGTILQTADRLAGLVE